MTQTAYEQPYTEVTPAAVPVPSMYQGGGSFFLSAFLFAASLVCFTGGLFADMAYVNSADIEWSNSASWLLAFGMIFIALTIVAGLVGFLPRVRRRRSSSNWLYGLLVLAAAVIGLFDNFVHTHDGWTSVWPTGLALSVITVVLLFIALFLKLASLSKTYVVDAR